MKTMKWVAASGMAFLLAGCGAAFDSVGGKADAPAGATTPAPTYTNDADWMKLPPGMKLGNVAGVAAGADDHIWVLHRVDLGSIPTAYGIGPAIMEFDPEGNYLGGFGGATTDEYTWFTSEHGLYVDDAGFVWVTGNSGADHYALKFSRDGQFMLQVGQLGVDEGSNSTTSMGNPADLYVDVLAKDLYVADGYANKRVVVFDTETGAYKRHWGAYGNVPDDAVTDPSEQFSTPVHCVNMSSDGLVYACDRQNNRVQVFKPDGTFVQEFFPEFTHPQETGNVMVFDVGFSEDAGQDWLFVADGSMTTPPGSDRVLVMDRRTGEVVGQVGSIGPGPGQLAGMHAMTNDSNSNLFTGELHVGRVQRWVKN